MHHAKLFLITAVACQASSPIRDAALPALSASDWRQEFIGAWQIEFVLDSVRVPDQTDGVMLMRAVSGPSVLGRFTLTDSIVDAPWIRGLRSSLIIDDVALLGRPMSCFEPRPTTTRIERQNGGVIIDFTPGAADCGLTALVQMEGDSVIGRWREGGFTGPPATGRVSLRRNQ
jgi:hypothetical protein